ncbi:MAG: aminotransferase class III-fold pyridoxal phosphate-dependent enzyme [Candidatus Woesearchaeota archaeon]
MTLRRSILIVESGPRRADLEGVLKASFPDYTIYSFAQPSDVNLPELSGVDVVIGDYAFSDQGDFMLAELAQHNPNARQLILANQDQVSKAVGLISDGRINGYILKPLEAIEAMVVPVLEELFQRIHLSGSEFQASQLDQKRVIDIFKDYGNPILTKLLQMFGMDTRFAKAEGQYVFDADGEKYLDLLGSFGALNLGHNPPQIEAKLREIAMSPKLLQPGLNPYHAEVLMLLDQITPDSVSRAYLANSGAEATEAALKLVAAATGKSAVVHTQGSFHGKTLGALSVTGNRKYQGPFSGLLVQQPVIPYNDPEALEKMLSSRDDIAAFIVEPIQGEGGINVPSSDYLQRVRDICTEHGVLLIVDEIQTGLGRTGKMFASSDINPDVLLIGKSLGGGHVPVSAMMTSDKLWNLAYGTTDSALLHTSTFSGNTTACAVAAESIRTLLSGNYIDRAKVLGDYLLSGLQYLQEMHDIIKEVRGQGLMIGIEFNKPFLGNLMTENYLGQIIAGQLFRNYHIITSFTLNRPNILRIEPPLTITKEDIDYALKSMDDLFTRLPKPEHHVATMIQYMTSEDLDEMVEMGTIIGGRQEPVDLDSAHVNVIADRLIADPALLMLRTKTYGSLDPDRRELVSSVYTNTITEINQRALQASCDAAKDFHAVPMSQRHKALAKWGDLVTENFSSLVKIGTFEGFSYQAMLWQLDTILNILDPEHLVTLENMMRPYQTAQGSRTVFYRESIPGVVGITPAANAAIVLGTLGVASSVSSGKSFVMSAGTSLTTHTLMNYLIDAFEENGIDPAPINVIYSNNRGSIKEWPGFGISDSGIVTVDPSLEQRRALDFVAYWGPRNEKLMESFDKAGIQGSYDLNGSDPIIVNKDADIDRAVSDIMLRYAASGQICISPKRAIVHEDAAGIVLEKVNYEIKQLRAGLLSDPTTDLMPVPGIRDRSRYEEAIKQALGEGGLVYISGELVPLGTEFSSLELCLDYQGKPVAFGPYLAPAVVQVPPGKQFIAALEEMFNPLLSFQIFSTPEEAINLANSSRYGIRAGVWAEDTQFVNECVTRIGSASVFVNTPHLNLSPDSPDLGGGKDSGRNIGPGGAKYLVYEFAGPLKQVKFYSKEAAKAFMAGYKP